MSALIQSLSAHIKLKGATAKLLYLSLFDRKLRRQAGQLVFSGQSVGES